MISTTEVLTLPRAAFGALPEQGGWHWRGLPAVDPVWLARAQAETDEHYLQLIPYLLLRNRDGAVWCYARRGGDGRLRDRLSCGVGGHVERIDQRGGPVATLTAALTREAAEEIGAEVAARMDDIRPQAWIFERLSAIGRVHIGVLYVLPWTAAEPPQPREPALESRGFMTPEAILAESRFERWSRLAVGWLREVAGGT